MAIRAFIKKFPLVSYLHKHYGYLLRSYYWRDRIRARKFSGIVRQIQTNLKDVEISLKRDEVLLIHDGIKFKWNIDRPLESLLGIPMQGEFETSETRAVRALINPGDHVLDIGGNFGWYSCHIASWIGESGRILSFEPNAENKLAENIELNGFEGRCQIFEVALSDKEGEVTLHIPIDNGPGWATLTDQTDLKCKTIKIPSLRLDSFLEKEFPERIHFIKIDVEGAELQVLKGGSRCLETYKPIVFIEVDQNRTKYFDYDANEVFRLLESFGYHFFEILTETEFKIKRVENVEQAQNYNFLATTSEKVFDGKFEII